GDRLKSYVPALLGSMRVAPPPATQPTTNTGSSSVLAGVATTSGASSSIGHAFHLSQLQQQQLLFGGGGGGGVSNIDMVENALMSDPTADPSRRRMAQELSQRVGFPPEVCAVALQETNYDRARAMRMLLQRHESDHLLRMWGPPSL